jgi:hypothetical protein
VALIAIGDNGDQRNVYLEATLHQGAGVDEMDSPRQGRLVSSPCTKPH